MTSIEKKQLEIRQTPAYGRVGERHISHPEGSNREYDYFGDSDKNANGTIGINPGSKKNNLENTDVNLGSKGD